MLNVEPFERGKGYWKLNNSLLYHKEYVDYINVILDDILLGSSCRNGKDEWENIKAEIKKQTIKYSKSKASEEKIVLSQLTEVVNTYEANLPLNRKDSKLLEETKSELEEKLFDRIKGTMFRCKAKWYEQGEKSSKYFFALEKARYNAKTCYKLVTEIGEEIIEPNRILEEQKQFYQKLYSVDQEVSFNMQNEEGIVVPEQIYLSQKEQITLLDLETAIKQMNNGKTPGEDGIPVDFYKVFWGKLKIPFYRMVLASYEDFELHSTARKGILNLIPKANKDTRYIKNLRPITLLNTDYKIIEKAVALKMVPALKHIIHPDQRGFMKERRISVNIRKILDIMQYAAETDLEAVVLSLDFVKCFDKCSFSILHGSLEYFKFGEIVKEWTKILYKDFTVKVQNNGYFSDQIEIKKGVHQGGCCSAIYFLVIAEILAISLRGNEDIEGITVRDIRNLLNQFADDMDVCSISSEKSIKAIYEELDRFRYQSGFTVSYDKTTLYRIGSLRHSDAELYNLTQYAWSNKDITVLGVTIAHDDLTQKNYAGMIKKAKTVLEAWYNRGLSLLGKVQVVNALVASQFVYKMMVLPNMPERVVKSIDNTIREFLWNGRKAKIAYHILQSPKKEGGLNLVNLRKKETSLKATWPIILSQEREYATMVYALTRIGDLGEDIWRCNLFKEHVAVLKIKSDFWNDVLESWCEYNFQKETRIENQLLWYNSRILVKGKPFFWKDVFLRGLRYVHQMFENQEYRSFDTMWEEYGLTKLRYNSLKKALPMEWKQFFYGNAKEAFIPIPPHSYDIELLGGGKGLAGRIYKFIADDIMSSHNKYLKWKIDLGEDFCENIVQFAQMHQHIYKVTNVPKYRSFQYRVLQRGLVTNINLKAWGMVESDLCYYCNLERETIVHLLAECENVLQFWKEIQVFIQQYFGLEIRIGAIDLIGGMAVDKVQHVANFIVLMGKQFIYRQRCLKGNLSIAVFKRLVLEVERIEKYIAVQNGRVALHNKKWLSLE